MRGTVLAAVAACGGCAALAYWLGKRTAGAISRIPTVHKQAFVLMVSLTFQDISHRDHWVSLWLPLVQQVHDNEPGTLGYELLVADDDPHKILVYERYATRDDYIGPHRGSAAFLAFKQAAAQLPFDVMVSGQSYFETNLGFM